MMQNMRTEKAKEDIQLAAIHDHSNPARILAEARHLYCLFYPSRSFSIVADAFRLTRHLYSGRFPGYGACLTEYHDYAHVLDVFAATARLLDGRLIEGSAQSAEGAADLLIAASPP